MTVGFPGGAITQQNSGTPWTSKGAPWKAHLLPFNGSETAVAQSTELGDFRQTPDCCPQSRLLAVSCSSTAFYPKACALVDF